MRLNDIETLIREMNGKHVDFYLEDDMFEIEGMAVSTNDSMGIRVLDAVGHVLEMCGPFLEVEVKNRKLYARRTDTGKTFEMEINRLYERLEEPAIEDFLQMRTTGANQFLKKQSDTLVWFDEDQKSWYIELNKINMCFSGNRTSYANLDELFTANREHMGGVWQAVSYSSAVEDEETYGKDYC